MTFEVPSQLKASCDSLLWNKQKKPNQNAPIIAFPFLSKLYLKLSAPAKTHNCMVLADHCLLKEVTIFEACFPDCMCFKIPWCLPLLFIPPSVTLSSMPTPEGSAQLILYKRDKNHYKSFAQTNRHSYLVPSIKERLCRLFCTINLSMQKSKTVQNRLHRLLTKQAISPCLWNYKQFRLTKTEEGIALQSFICQLLSVCLLRTQQLTEHKQTKQTN